MASQPPVRPWFRFAALRSVPAPAPAPAPPVTFRTTPSPPKEPVPPPRAPAPAPLPAAPSPPPPLAPAVTAGQFLASVERERASSAPSSMPTSPVQKGAVSSPSSFPVAKPSNTYSPPKVNTEARVGSSNGSPKTIKPAFQTPVQSPKGKASSPVPAPPPSPLTLPSSQVRSRTEVEPRIPDEAEPKTVLIQKTIQKHKSLSSGNGEYQRELGLAQKPGIGDNGKHVAAKDNEGKEKGIHKKLSDSEDSGMRVITIAGENRGAVMEIVQSPKKHEFGDKPNYLHKKGNSKIMISASGSESRSSSSDESNLNKKDKSLKGRTSSAFPRTAFMNSNVQCVNNSLMFNASCKHNDPGVHLALSKKPFGEGFHVKDLATGQNY